MVQSHKPCINEKVTLRAHCHYHSHTKPCPCFLFFVSPHKGWHCLCQRWAFELKFMAWLGSFFWLHFSGDQLPVIGCGVIDTPTRWKHKKTNKTRLLFLAGVSEASFKTPKLPLNLILRGKLTWWKISLLYFAESHSGLGFRTSSIIGRKCYLISPQVMFLFLVEIVLHTSTPQNRCKMNRKSSFALLKTHHDAVLLYSISHLIVSVIAAFQTFPSQT